MTGPLSSEPVITASGTALAAHNKHKLGLPLSHFFSSVQNFQEKLKASEKLEIFMKFSEKFEFLEKLIYFDILTILTKNHLHLTRRAPFSLALAS